MGKFKISFSLEADKVPQFEELLDFISTTQPWMTDLAIEEVPEVEMDTQTTAMQNPDPTKAG